MVAINFDRIMIQEEAPTSNPPELWSNNVWTRLSPYQNMNDRNMEEALSPYQSMNDRYIQWLVFAEKPLLENLKSFQGAKLID